MDNHPSSSDIVDCLLKITENADPKTEKEANILKNSLKYNGILQFAKVQEALGKKSVLARLIIDNHKMKEEVETLKMEIDNIKNKPHWRRKLENSGLLDYLPYVNPK